MKILVLPALVILFFVADRSYANSAALSLIAADVARGTLDYRTALTYKAYSLFDPARLPVQYQTPAPVQATHGGLELNELRQHADLLPPDLRAKVTRTLDRPVLTSSRATTHSHFLIHYDLAGANAVTPAYLDSVAQVVEHCWDVEVSTLGYRTPPNDGDGFYDVYILDMTEYCRAHGYDLSYGFTTIDNYSTSSSYIIFDNNYTETGFSTQGVNAMKVTIAHEFFHAIQYGYTQTNYSWYWWMEINSTWMEDRVYDEINDYLQYLPSWFGTPNRSLMTKDGWHEYGSCLFNHFLVCRYGDALIKEIWENSASQSAPEEAIDQVLENHGTSLNAEFSAFTVWNWFTGPRADTLRYYPEGATYPLLDSTLFYNQHIESPAQIDSQVRLSWDVAVPLLEAFGCQYIIIDSVHHLDSVRLGFGDNGSTAWRVGLVLEQAAGRCTTAAMDMLDEEEGVYDFINTTPVQRVVMTAARVAWAGFPYYQYYISKIPASAGLRLLDCYPNPMVVPQFPSSSGRPQVYFPFSLAEAGTDLMIRIYSSQGELVRSIPVRNSFANLYRTRQELAGQQACWDLTNEAGKPAASGLYYYQFVIGKQDKFGVRKFSVIR